MNKFTFITQELTILHNQILVCLDGSFAAFLVCCLVTPTCNDLARYKIDCLHVGAFRLSGVLK